LSRTCNARPPSRARAPSPFCIAPLARRPAARAAPARRRGPQAHRRRNRRAPRRKERAKRRIGVNACEVLYAWGVSIAPSGTKSMGDARENRAPRSCPLFGAVTLVAAQAAGVQKKFERRSSLTLRDARTLA